MLQKSLKSGQTIKISSTLENYTNSINNKQDNTSNCKIIISFYDIFQKKTNTKADIISRKDQVDTKDDNKKKLTGKRNYIVRGNSKEQYKRAKNQKKVKKRRQPSIER